MAFQKGGKVMGDERGGGGGDGKERLEGGPGELAAALRCDATTTPNGRLSPTWKKRRNRFFERRDIFCFELE